MRTAVITFAHGRHEHLRAQQRGLRCLSTRPDHYVIVAMDDPSLAGEFTYTGIPDSFLELPANDGGKLPFAAARNAGAEAAIDRGAELLIFLDVDCIPGRGLVRAYTEAAARPETAGRLLSGPVTYLPEAGPGGYPIERIEELDAPHSARPAPKPGEWEFAASPDLFWSLSFAVSVDAWRTIGGFAEEYVGYGGEDTDFGYAAAQQGIDLVWIGGARAYHQWHPTSSPPVQHVEDIVRNSNLFYSRWGSWPMSGWLTEFRERGLIAGGLGTEPARVL